MPVESAPMAPAESTTVCAISTGGLTPQRTINANSFLPKDTAAELFSVATVT